MTIVSARLLRAFAFAAALAGAPAAAQQTTFQYQNITTDATTTLKSSRGFLHTVCINTPAAAATVTIFDSTAGSGTKIGTITSFASVAGCFVFDVSFWTGLTIVTATAAADITVSFR